jgi:tRNA pseudouridine55 synthase
LNGFLCINKPHGPSSFKIIDQLRRTIKEKKAGHAGTLDPYATGLLVVALGSYTRLLQFLPLEPKVYQFGIQFGSSTETDDSEGQVVNSGGIVPSPEAIIEKLHKFTGVISQVPPIYSAIKIQGERAYKLARNGKNVEMQPRPVTIGYMRMLKFDGETGIAHMEASCSGGTYVRSLARDIAFELGTFGYAAYVHRITIGKFKLDDALKPECFNDAEKYIIRGEQIFSDCRIDLIESQRDAVFLGKDISVDSSLVDGKSVVMAFFADNLVAVLKQAESNMYHPEVVLSNMAGLK